MENYNQEIDKLLRDVNIFSNTEEENSEEGVSNSTYSQLIEELKNYSNIVAGFRRKSMLGKETLRLKVS